MNVNHGTLPCETVETCVKLVKKVLKVCRKYEIPWDDFMKPMV